MIKVSCGRQNKFCQQKEIIQLGKSEDDSQAVRPTYTTWQQAFINVGSEEMKRPNSLQRELHGWCSEDTSVGITRSFVVFAQRSSLNRYTFCIGSWIHSEPHPRNNGSSSLSDTLDSHTPTANNSSVGENLYVTTNLIRPNLSEFNSDTCRLADELTATLRAIRRSCWLLSS